jgi:hypothetical protein
VGNREIEGARRRLSGRVDDGQGHAMIAHRQSDVMGNKATGRLLGMLEQAADDVDAELGGGTLQISPGQSPGFRRPRGHSLPQVVMAARVRTSLVATQDQAYLPA